MLPQFGIAEFLLLSIVALIVVGPKDLPVMMRKMGKMVGKAKAMAREFQSAFDDIARQAELDELRKEIEDLKRDNALKQAEEDLRAVEKDINDAVMREHPPGGAKDAPELREPDEIEAGRDEMLPKPVPEDKAKTA